jgi:hypothetical protein
LFPSQMSYHGNCNKVILPCESMEHIKSCPESKEDKEARKRGHYNSNSKELIVWCETIPTTLYPCSHWGKELQYNPQM